MTTDHLLRSLHASPTDLARLVRRVDQRHAAVVAVSLRAIARWNEDARESWERVRVWLDARGVRVIEC